MLGVLFGNIAASRVQAPFDPLSVAGLKVWLKADAMTLADADPVASWTDSSGGGHDFPQTSVGNRPTFRTGVLGGKPVIRFIGLRPDSLFGGDLSALFPAAATMFVVAVVPATDYLIYTTRSNASYWRYSGDGHGYLGAFRSSRANGYPTTMPSSGAHLFSLISSSSNYEMFIGGVSQGSQSADYLGGDAHIIGAQGGGPYFDGDIAEILIYDSALSGTDRGHVESYLAAKYGL